MFMAWFSSAPGEVLSGLYSPRLVALSIGVAIFCAILALQIAGLADPGRAGPEWLR